MSHPRILLSALFVAALCAAGIAQAQSSLRGGGATTAPRGITDIMRAGPQRLEPPVAATPGPTPAPTTTARGPRVGA